ncbi:hypothetical protein P280DRAFT_472000 [Massarina eburnea CBS 473.64]|uniref:Wings apart-like protein C-terminal domain-containing protein n=1 Tax=Massarina eburnea CBS 473.64 TaxID=1395130 RepID=A0A6A6RR64_9PLEO|nr:hypothetical protein P280DRAFT_472000 [Massarina eburnea CBS 473.64]
MAMPMPSTFTAGERRKKTVTYGKPARYTSSNNIFDDAPSPERQRTGTHHESAPRKKISAVTQDVDVFDFPPSEDEKPPTAPKNGKSVPSSRKAEVAPPALKRKAQEKEQEVALSSEDALAAPPRRRAKSPQVIVKSPVRKAQPATRMIRSRATTPAPLVAVSRKAKDTTSNKTDVSKPMPGIKSPTLDVFDVPSSDDDVSAKTPMKPQPAPRSRNKVVSPISQAPPSPSLSGDSDVSTKSNKRKRRAPVASSVAAKTTIAGEKREPSLPPRNRKYQKKENSISPGHDVAPVRPLVPHVKETSEEYGVVNKPARTRLRTGPAPPKASITKGQSSPAQLHSMLVDRSKPKPKPAAQPAPALPESSFDDETMCEPQETTPPKKSKKMAVPGSVTPRQKTLFQNLLDDSSDSATPMPDLKALKITARKPGSIASLLRSSSDIPQSAHTRKSRLIDMLKQAASSSDEESESESDEEAEEEIIDIPSVSASAKTINNGPSQVGSRDASNAMDIDSDTAGNSPASQAATKLHTGGKRTYAKQRSYLEEQGDNMEDLLNNILDDEIGGFETRNQSSLSEDEDITGMHDIHNLRNTGQQQKFNQEVDFAIDDIAGEGLNASQRRGAMMEFATLLADKNYVGQLLESPLTSRLLRSLSSNDEIIFDVAAAVAVLFILQKRPGGAILEEIHQSPIIATLGKLFGSKFASMDIHRISKERKTNMSLRARETVAEFRTLLLNSSIWSTEKPDKVSPQLLATKVLELLVVGLRQTGNAEALLDENMVAKVVDVASGPCQRLEAGKATVQDHLLLDTAFSALESLSVFKEAAWSNDLMSRLADMMPAVFETADNASPTRLAIRLCINLTNDKPKACKIFSRPAFIQPLLRSIGHNFKLLVNEVDAGRRTEINEDLIFSLGAMINLAECSEKARASAINDGDDVVEDLVQIFLEGSERADQADSMEESQFIVPIGYLTILLGNLCLDTRVRQKVRNKLPDAKIDMLVQKIREFVAYNQRVDRLTGKFDGSEGAETHRNFTHRLMLVVQRLEKAGA